MFVVSGTLFCEDYPTQCMTSLKSLACLIVSTGVLVVRLRPLPSLLRLACTRDETLEMRFSMVSLAFVELPPLSPTRAQSATRLVSSPPLAAHRSTVPTFPCFQASL